MNKLNSFNLASSKTAQVQVEVPVNHIFVIDCSGSMCYDLPKIRLQLKNKLPSLLKKDDTISLVWFSGRGEFGKLVEKVHVSDLNDLNRLNTAIDRWLNPVGCTGFVEPLRTVKDLCGSNDIYSMMFLTDGCDNEWSKSEILSSSKELADLLSNAVFVEYGYYCNHALLTEMADATNGAVVFAEDFDRYDPIFDGICKRKVTNKRIEVKVGDPAEGFVWSCSDAGAVSYKVQDGKVFIPEDVDKIYWFDKDQAQAASPKMDWKPLYQGLSALALNRKSEFVKKQLSDIGDVALYNQYANAYGKQNLYDFADLLMKAGTDKSLRFTKGQKSGIQPDENAFTVLDLLNDLRSHGAKLDLSMLKYNRIGRAAEMSGELSKAETQALSESIASSGSVAEIKEHTDAAMRLASERSAMKFKRGADKIKVSSFSYNETRPNVSLLVNIPGEVDLPSDAPNGLPHTFKTHVFRNYTVIKDGLLNIEELPVEVDEDLAKKWKALGVSFEKAVNGTCLVDLRSLPIINSRMVKSIKATTLADEIYEHMMCKAAAKVYKGFLEEIKPSEKSEALKSIYGEEAAEWLKSVGITDSGFSPKVKLSKPTDKYMSVEFLVKFKGLSSVPSFNALVKKLSSGKSLTIAESLLKPAYDECVRKKQELGEEEFIQWLEDQLKLSDERADELYKKIVEDKFSILIGQTWFSDLDVNSPTLTNHGIDVTFEIKDTEVEI